MPVLGFEGPLDAVAVRQTRARLGEVDVPDLVGVLLHPDALTLPPRILRVEQTELYRGRVLAEEGEIDSGPIPRGAERVG